MSDGGEKGIHEMLVPAARLFWKEARRNQVLRGGGYRRAGMRRGGEKKQAIMAENNSLNVVFSLLTKFCQAPSSFMWAFRRKFVREIARLILVRKVFNSFIFYSIDRKKRGK